MDIAEMLKKHQKIKEVKIEEYKGIEAHQRYYNEAGEELTINPGKTFIILFPNNRTKDVTVS